MKGLFSLAALVSAASAAALPYSKLYPRANHTAVANHTVSTANKVAADDSGYWYGGLDHTTSVAPGQDGWTVYKNIVTDYQADPSGNSDASTAFNNAMDSDSRLSTALTAQPRVIFIPSGTYEIDSPIQLKIDTVLIGDAVNPPVLKASANFNGDHLIYGRDPSTNSHGELSFATVLKNIVLDSTAIDAGTDFTNLAWGVAQACALSNVVVNMPAGGHTGVNVEQGSTISVADVSINGGNTGVVVSNQQVLIKGFKFSKTTTAISVQGGFSIEVLGATFDGVGTAVDMSQNQGPFVSLIDCSSNGGTVLALSGYPNCMIENLAYTGSDSIVTKDGSEVLAASSQVNTWVYGNTDLNPSYQTPAAQTTNGRPTAIAPDGKFFITPAPTYSDVSASQVVNVKSQSQKVAGDGQTDDTAALQSILNSAASANQVVFFPFGVYIVTDTLVVPPGSRIVGEGWPAISGKGDAFNDESNPKAIVQVGAPGSTGVAQIQDMRFSVAEPLAGAIIVEINMSGNPGDVGIWNSLSTIGGTPDAQGLLDQCNDGSNPCKSAFIVLHLTESSSAYIDNYWAWTADHTTDGAGGGTQMATGRGVLVESTKATWLVGIGSEHHWIYQINYNGAQNVFSSLQQTETNYNQGDGSSAPLLPAPFSANADLGDPDYSGCNGDQRCSMGLAQNFNGGSDQFVYNAASWVFFPSGCGDGDDNACQQTMNKISSDPSNLQLFGLGTRATQNILEASDGSDITLDNNTGGWGGILSAYRKDAKSS